MLGDAGLDVRMGPDGRGVIADTVLSEERPARGLLGLRADIDALRIHDEKDVSVPQPGGRRDARLRSRLSHRDRVHGVADAVAAGAAAALALADPSSRAFFSRRRRPPRAPAR